MSEINLNVLSKDELLSLRERIDHRMVEVDREARAKALEAVKAAAAEHGFNVHDLVGKPEQGGRKGAGRAAASVPNDRPARYANPQDPSQTWSGRGRRPAWVKAALDGGASIESLSIS